MRFNIFLALATAAVLAGSLAPADARVRQGHSVRAQQRVNNAAPGVAKELRSDSKQSATGGQAGGLPGQ